MSADREKEVAALASVDEIKPGMVVGLGTGSTAEKMIRALGERVAAGLSLKGVVPTSKASLELARSLHIPISTLSETPEIDVTIDGADEADERLDLIKGGGGALLHEKIVASATKRYVIVVDSKKLVHRLGAFKVPIEVISAAVPVVARRIGAMGGLAKVRTRANGETFLTDESNPILDCDFGLISDSAGLARNLDAIPGVVEHGLFVGITDLLIIGRGEQVERLERKR